MLYPILVKRILNRIRLAFEDLLINKTNVLHYDKYEPWLIEYFDLKDEDKKNLLTKVERSQSASIMYGMQKQDREIFINQLGCFYIKQTTIDFYSALDKLTAGKNKDEYDFEVVKQSALEQTRDLYIKRANNKKNAKSTIDIFSKIQTSS